MATQGSAVFGPTSTITTAPVAFGNSISGSTPIVRPVQDGVRIMGRDFMFQLAAVSSSTQTNWVCAGGAPLAPHAFVASMLRGFASMYAEFVVHGFTFHYITGAPTTIVGDLMFYVNKDRGSALLDTSNSNFMSVVLSDPHTVISPLWKNCSAVYVPEFKMYTTNIFNDEPLHNQCPGEVFVYTKTSAASTIGSPGYVLIDFDITFKTMQTNPRDLLFPIARLKYTQYGMGYATNITISAGVEAAWRTNCAKLDGTFGVITDDPAIKLGDVYKIVMCPQYGAFSLVTSANLLIYSTRQGNEIAGVANQALTIDDGFTCFGVYMAPVGGTMMLYPTFQAAMSQQYPYLFGISATNCQWDIPCWLSLVGNVGGVTYQSNF